MYDYDTDPDNASVVQGLIAYRRTTTPATVEYDINGTRYAETEDDATTDLPAPEDWMLEKNYFYQTVHPTDTTGNTAGGSGYRTTLLIKGVFASLQAARNSAATLTGYWHGSGYTQSILPWRPVGQTPDPTPAVNERLFMAVASATVNENGIWSQGAWYVFEASTDVDVQFSSVLDPDPNDASDWHFPQSTTTTDLWLRRRFAGSQTWGPPEPIDARAFVGWRTLATRRGVFDSHNLPVTIETASFNLDDYSEIMVAVRWLSATTSGATKYGYDEATIRTRELETSLYTADHNFNLPDTVAIVLSHKGKGGQMAVMNLAPSPTLPEGGMILLGNFMRDVNSPARRCDGLTIYGANPHSVAHDLMILAR